MDVEVSLGIEHRAGLLARRRRIQVDKRMPVKRLAQNGEVLTYTGDVERGVAFTHPDTPVPRGLFVVFCGGTGVPGR